MLWSKQTILNRDPAAGAVFRLRRALEGADAVVIGAGAGLSASAGLAYDGARFRKYFSDFGQKSRFHDMYAGGFYPYPTPEEHWAYWSRYILINRYMDAPKPVYQDLLALVKDKDYFVLTTNVDHCFQKAGFDKKRLFYTQGDYGLFQCAQPCCRENRISPVFASCTRTIKRTCAASPAPDGSGRTTGCWYSPLRRTASCATWYAP